jgi:hypothetical protein
MAGNTCGIDTKMPECLCSFVNGILFSITVAPRRPSVMAIALPMPLLAPVTMATLLFSSKPVFNLIEF